MFATTLSISENSDLELAITENLNWEALFDSIAKRLTVVKRIKIKR